MTTQAPRVEGITVRAVHHIEGERWLVTDCSDFETYRSLPSIVFYEGEYHSKMGWNSDTGNVGYVNRKGTFATSK